MPLPPDPLLSSTLFFLPDGPALVLAVECRPRARGYRTFLANVKTAGSTVRVAYFGGWITEQAGLRVKSLDHIRKAYPGVTFEEINAAIGEPGLTWGFFGVGGTCWRRGRT